MKKTIVTLALLCAVLLPFSAMAETAAVTWDEMQPAVEALGLEGDFYSLQDLGLAIWLPDGMTAAEVSEEDAAPGRLYLIMDEDCYLAVDAVYVEGMTLDRAYENAVASGMYEPEIVEVNGLSALSYKDEGNNVGVVVLVDTNCNMILFSFGPIDSETAEAAFSVIFSSLMPLE